jgi:hypothetical protein
MDTEDSTAARCGRSRDVQKGRNRLSPVGRNLEPAVFEIESTQLSPAARAFSLLTRSVDVDSARGVHSGHMGNSSFLR